MEKQQIIPELSDKEEWFFRRLAEKQRDTGQTAFELNEELFKDLGLDPQNDLGENVKALQALLDGFRSRTSPYWPYHGPTAFIGVVIGPHFYDAYGQYKAWRDSEGEARE